MQGDIRSICSIANQMSIVESIEDEDEVLTALADELGNFVEYVGGPEFAHTLLSPLENLAAIEEPIVREKACSYKSIIKRVHSKQHFD